MTLRIIVCIYLTAVICSVSCAENKRVKVFNNDESRIEFANLLSSLVKLNEQRINVIKKMNTLNDYGSVREVLRSGLRNRKGGHNARNLLIFIVPNNQSKTTRRKVRFTETFDPYYDNIEQHNNPETHKWYTQAVFTPITEYQNKQFEHMKHHYHADNFKNPIVYRDGFNLHAEKYPQPDKEYIIEGNNYNTRRQGVFKNKIKYASAPNTDFKPVTDFKSNLINRNRHRKSEEKPFNEHDSLSDDDMMAGDIKVTKGMGDFDPVTKRKISKHIEPLQGNIDEMSLEKHNEKYLKKIKKHKLVEPHKSKDLDKSNKQINVNYNDQHKSNVFITPSNSHITYTENTGNYKFSDAHEMHKMPTVMETYHNHDEGGQNYHDVKRYLPESGLSLMGNRDTLIRYSEPHKDYPDKRLALIGRQDMQNRFPQSERDGPIKLSAMNQKQDIFIHTQQYPEHHRDYQTSEMVPIEKNNNIKSMHNQLASQVDSLLPEIQFNRKPSIFNNMFDHSEPPKEMSITGFAMVGNQHVLNSNPMNNELKRDFSLTGINNNEMLNKMNLLQGPTETNKMFSPIAGTLNKKQDTLKNIQDNPSNRPIENHLEHAMQLNEENNKLREGNPTSLDKDKNKDKAFHGAANKFGRQGKTKQKIGRHDESDVDFLKAEVHLSDDEELESIGDQKELNEALRKNSALRSDWQTCFGKKALKKCRKACNAAYKNVCRRLKCTSKSKKDLKKECDRSCKKLFKVQSSSESRNSCESY